MPPPDTANDGGSLAVVTAKGQQPNWSFIEFGPVPSHRKHANGVETPNQEADKMR